MRAKAHPRQDERLAALRRYAILDTPRERDYDEVVALVARLCDAPIAVVNLIDEDRQWFKAEVGLGVRETPLETSLCSHVILEDDYVEIPDTLQDARMSDNPLCLETEAPLRFYAGAQLKTHEGLAIGTLCVLDHEPRRLTPLQRDAVRLLADLVMRQLDLRLALQQQEIIRRESDHRVKNSLAGVAAMLNIQARSSGDEEVSAALQEASGRVHAAALLHRQMHEADSGAGVDLHSFMEAIVKHLRREAPEGVALRVSFPARTVSPEVASSLASVVTEFVANSFKHGYPEGRSGTVRIGATSDGPGLIIEGRDDGVGSAATKRGAEGAMGSGLGRLIMRAAADKIGGALDAVVDEAGARFTLRVPNLPTAAPPTEDR